MLICFRESQLVLVVNGKDDIEYLFDYPVALVAVEWLMLGSKEVNLH